MNKGSIAYHYVHYQESDFLTDPYFQEWVYAPTKEHDAYWQEVMEECPQQVDNIEHARLYLKSISFTTHTPTDEQVELSWQKHLAQLPVTEHRVGTGQLWLKVAAVLTGIILIIGAWLLWPKPGNEQIIASTRYGEIRQVMLPDGSQVDLNANSKIRYSKHNSREIWLEGEALFNVKAVHEQFLVHTKDLTVTVLGTVFDIRQRRRKTEIVLQSGKIQLSFASGKAQDIIMTPGQIVSYSDEDESTITTNTSPEKFSAWKNQRLILQDPKVSDILIYLEDNFGKQIIIENPELATRSVNGPILISSLDDALFVLSTVLNTEIVKRDSMTIIMRSRGKK